jgi:hypothetical protein
MAARKTSIHRKARWRVATFTRTLLAIAFIYCFRLLFIMGAQPAATGALEASCPKLITRIGVVGERHSGV